MVGSVGNVSNKREGLPMIQEKMGNVSVFIVLPILQDMVGCAVNVEVLTKFQIIVRKAANFSN